MTPEEVHQYNNDHAIAPISFNAVCEMDFIAGLRVWFEKWLALAYEAGFQNAKKGEL